MTETTSTATPVAETPVATPALPKKAPAKQKKNKKRIKNIIVVAVVLAIAGVGGFFLWDKVLKPQPEDLGELMTEVVMRSSIQSMVKGSGTTQAKDSAAITPAVGGSILKLFVKEGDKVTKGDPLYTMDSADAQKAMTDAQKVVTNTAKELQAIYDSYKDLTITAPHAGKMTAVATIKPGDDVAKGTKIATIIDDTKLKLSLYFSYAYVNDISVGQSASVSLPATMSTLTGKVETINKVEYIVPEGSILFEVVIVLDNPGTLAQDMAATATLSAANGDPIFPYKADMLKNYQTTELTAKVDGPVEQAGLLNYAAVTTGQVLVKLGAQNNDEVIATKENAMSAAQAKLDETRQTLSNYNAVAPISGTILACNLSEGAKVESGQGITIADTSVMTVTIQVDERNISFVKPGMMVSLDQYGTPYMGVVDTVSLTAKAENGVAAFPATVKVDNPDGTLLTNMYLDYSFVASQSDNCLVVPVPAVQYVSLVGTPGEPGMADGGMIGGDVAPTPTPTAAVETPPAETGTPAPTETPDVSVSVDSGTSGGSISVSGGSSISIIDGPVPRARMMPGITIGGMGGGGNSGSASTGGDTATVVYVYGADEGKTPPPNAIPADPAWNVPAGYYPVIVVVGLSDTKNAEIISGLNEGDTVFVAYATQNANSWG